jgi:hypothetical protein
MGDGSDKLCEKISVRFSSSKVYFIKNIEYGFQ